ncbi:MAG: molybdate ABC transporter permease subunit [Sulfurovum sp.]|jgi:molybdate transport system permease protein|nr:molybdate ABC transporter permease subunit [Sulfurovum sp.]MDD3601907.1 molybdate ABC transporter permease subunit [Sulfurovum sp.]MDQ1326409.1 Molybdenum transport system permease [Campylobacterota bacterium]
MEWLYQPSILSLKVSVATIVLHLFLGIGIAYYLSGRKTFIKSIVDILVTIPIVFPPIALGFFLLLLFGKNGIIGQLFARFDIEIIFSMTGVLIASFVAGLPLVVKPVQAAIDEQSKRYAEASYTLGKSKFHTLIFVLLPNIKKVILVSVFLGFGRSLGEVGITLMLGGNIIGKTDTISLAIYNYSFGGEIDKAIVLSLILGAVSIGLFLALRKLAYL